MSDKERLMCDCDYPTKTICKDGFYSYEIKGNGVPFLNTKKILHCKRWKEEISKFSERIKS